MPAKSILFVLNSASGNSDNNFKQDIETYFAEKHDFSIDFFEPDWDNKPEQELKKLLKHDFSTVVASGGDGTVKFVAQTLYGSNLEMGILPTGSANGLAKNLNIPINIKEALDIITAGKTMPVSSLTVNGVFCIHLSDIGLNASIVKRFEEQKTRGILGYGLALKNVLFKQKRFRAKVDTGTEIMHNFFYMLVFCNGTGYGTGLAINPEGKLHDHKFEIVAVEKLSLLEGMRLYFGQDKPKPEFAKITSCRAVEVSLSRNVHLQVDGEYLGETSIVRAQLNSEFINMLTP